MMSLLGIWFKHRDILPSFDTFIRQRRTRGMCQCRKCGTVFQSLEDWRSRTQLVERYQLVAGGKTWERRICNCGAVRRNPIPEGESHAESRNP